MPSQRLLLLSSAVRPCTGDTQGIGVGSCRGGGMPHIPLKAKPRNWALPQGLLSTEGLSPLGQVARAAGVPACFSVSHRSHWLSPS